MFRLRFLVLGFKILRCHICLSLMSFIMCLVGQTPHYCSPSNFIFLKIHIFFPQPKLFASNNTRLSTHNVNRTAVVLGRQEICSSPQHSSRKYLFPFLQFGFWSRQRRSSKGAFLKGCLPLDSSHFIFAMCMSILCLPLPAYHFYTVCLTMHTLKGCVDNRPPATYL